MADTDWTRPFRLHLADGRTWHGALFPPSEGFPHGFVCVHHPDEVNVVTIAASLNGLFSDLLPEHPLHGARADWPEPCPRT